MMMIFFNNMMIFIIMFLSGLIIFIMNYKYMLINLLSLEYMILSLFIMVYFYLININYELFFSMIFLTFSVCEGVLGLSLLILMIRNYGNNYFKSISFYLC